MHEPVSGSATELGSQREARLRAPHPEV